MTDDPARLLETLRRAQMILANCGTPLNMHAQRILTRVMLAQVRGETVTQKGMAEELGIGGEEMMRAVRLLEFGNSRGLGGLVNNHSHRGRPSRVTLGKLGHDVLNILETLLDRQECKQDENQGNP